MENNLKSLQDKIKDLEIKLKKVNTNSDDEENDDKDLPSYSYGSRTTGNQVKNLKTGNRSILKK